MTHKSLLILLIQILTLLPSCAFAETDNGYKIDSYAYTAKVHADKSWDITETISVTFLEERHGIFRHIPRRYVLSQNTNGGNATYTYQTKIKNVKVNGYEFTCQDAEDRQDNIVIKIGSENKVLSGQHKYTISYTIQYPEDRHATDALYFTMLGPDWNTEIGYYSFSIRFDKPLPREIPSMLHVFSGEWGSSDNKLGVNFYASSKEISGNVSNIAPGNGITIHAEMPKGYWEGGESVSCSPFMLCLALLAVCFIIVMGYLIFHRRKRPLMVLEYSAPDNISSAEVGVIIDNSADLSDLNSLIVWFASKGFLKIRETEDKKNSDIELTKLRDLPKEAPKYQQLFWKVFFEKQDKVLLSELGDRHELLSKALRALANHFHGKTSLTHTHWPTVIAFILYLIMGVGTFMTSSQVTSFEEAPTLFGIFLWAVPVFLAAVIRMYLSNYDMINKLTSRLAQYIIILLIGVASVAIYRIFMWSPNDTFMPFPVAACVILSGYIIAVFSGRMVRDSDYRKEKMSLLLGFKEFIEKSELPMLQQQVDENPSYFFDVLPYAMVFDLTNKWQKKFKEIDIQAPDWYESASPNHQINGLMAANSISHAMSHSISHAINIASHDPNVGGSHGGGGGFSGGGGGGGGGGSW